MREEKEEEETLQLNFLLDDFRFFLARRIQGQMDSRVLTVNVWTE